MKALTVEEMHIIKEVIIQLLYAEMYPLPEKSTAEECNNRKEKAMDKYLGKNLKPGELPILNYKVDKVMAVIHDRLPERLPKITEENLRGALARGYCTDRNKHKTLDSDLLDDCFNAVWEYLKERGEWR